MVSGMVLSLVASVFTPGRLFAANGVSGSPRVINLYLDWQLREEDLPTLAKWDAVVLDADQQARYPDRVRRLRQLNPSIKILAYLASEEISSSRFSEPSDYPGAKLASRIQPQWYVLDASGAHANFWPGSSLLDVTDRGPTAADGTRWNQFLPQFIHDEIMSSGLWDGVFLDNTFDNISYFAKSAVDLDRNGTADASAVADAAWRAGMTKMLQLVQSRNPGAIVMGNGGAVYASQLNGAFFEHFPSYSWGPNFKELRDAASKARSPNYTGLNTNTDNQDRPGDYKLMRYGLTSALAGGVWYSFDKGDWGHNVLWWYDEYTATLGAERAAPRLIQAGKANGTGVWRRDFDRGIVLLNSTETSQHVALDGTYEKLHGTQDASVNDGSLVTSIDLAPHDGILLTRKSSPQEIMGAAFVNGAFVRVYDAAGTQKQNGFFAQRTDAPSGALVVSADLDRDGSDDLVIANKGVLTIRFGSGTVRTIKPFGASYTGVLSLAVQNTNRDAAWEIIVGRTGVPPDVRIFNTKGTQIASWTAYHPKFTGGVRVAVGDLDGDGLREVVTGAGPGGGPHIRIWKTDGTVWGGSFFAFSSSESGGVSVAVGDVDHDGKGEIIVGSGQGAKPRVRVFSSSGILKKEISLGTTPLAQGVQVAASDIDGDGTAEIIVSGLSAF